MYSPADGTYYRDAGGFLKVHVNVGLFSGAQSDWDATTSSSISPSLMGLKNGTLQMFWGLYHAQISNSLQKSAVRRISI
jgi:hypothetical protein